MRMLGKPVLRHEAMAEIYGNREIQNCPTCNAPVELVRRADGSADRYDPILIENSRTLAKVDNQTAYKLRVKRKGLKTVALVGMSPSSCGLAPYDEKNVEIWGLNEAHLYDFMPRWDRWFQMHKEDYLLKNESLKGRTGHLPWLQTKHNKPIYTLYKHEYIPDSVEYPFVDVCSLLHNAYRGDKRIKYFTSTFAYMMALAIHEGFQRIEIYGFEMDMGSEYWMQRSNAEAWIFYALGKGIEIYIPPFSRLLLGILYGYNGTDYTRTPDLTEG